MSQPAANAERNQRETADRNKGILRSDGLRFRLDGPPNDQISHREIRPLELSREEYRSLHEDMAEAILNELRGTATDKELNAEADREAAATLAFLGCETP